MPMRSFKIERKKKQSEAAAPDAPEESTAEQAVESPDAAGDGDEAPRSQPPPGAAPLSAGQPAPAAPELSRRERRAAERQAKRAGRKGGQPDTAADEPTAAEGLEPGAAAFKAVPTLAIETPEPQPSAIATPEPEGGKKPGLLRRYMNYRNASIARQKEKKARKQDERRRREEERRAKREQKGAKPSPEPAPPPAPEPVAAAEAEPAMAPGSPEPHPVPPPVRNLADDVVAEPAARAQAEPTPPAPEVDEERALREAAERDALRRLEEAERRSDEQIAQRA
jgi:hypothetical protein